MLKRLPDTSKNLTLSGSVGMGPDDMNMGVGSGSFYDAELTSVPEK